MNNFKKSVTDELKVQISQEHITEILCDLLKVVERICKEESIQYFAYSRLLVYAVHYHRLSPYGWKYNFDIGMIRSDYEKFRKSVKKYERKLEFEAKFHPVYDSKGEYRAHYMYITKEVTLEEGGIQLSDRFRLRVAPFDKVPEAEDTRRGFYRTMKRINKIHRNVIDTRFYWKTSKKSFRKFLKKQVVYGSLDSKKTFRRMNEIAQRYNNTDSHLYQRVVGRRSKLIAEEDLFPLQRTSFGDMTISIPYNPEPWTNPDLHAYDERTQAIQKVDLEILAEFDRVCREIGVGYFLCGGSMLGYVRDDGFIPWDDDVDCGMLRKDYQKFLAEADKYIDHQRFFLQTRESDPSIPFLFSKLRRNDTLYVTEYNERRPYHKGICLDIFPFDYVPNDPVEREQHRVQAKKHARRHHFMVNRAKGNPPKEDHLQSKEDYWFRLLGTVHRMLFRSFPLTITQRNYDNFVQKYNDRAKELDLHTVASFVPTYTWADLDTLLPYQDTEFEGVRVMVAHKPEVFLTMQYGDFRSHPMPHKQVGHALVDWSVDTTVKENSDEPTFPTQLLESRTEMVAEEQGANENA